MPEEDGPTSDSAPAVLEGRLRGLADAVVTLVADAPGIIDAEHRRAYARFRSAEAAGAAAGTVGVPRAGCPPR
jgi:CTP:molybdopterin cytidylyltransferase MocA